MIFFSSCAKQVFKTLVLYICYKSIINATRAKNRKMKKLPSNAIKILKICHLLFSVMWLGGAMVLTIVSFSVIPSTFQEARIYAHLLDFIDKWMIIVGANGILVTGLVYSIWTNWGFTKYRWVIVKWTIVVLQILYGTFVLGPWITENINIVEGVDPGIFPNETFSSNLRKTAVWGSLQAIFLLFLFVISVWKPWGKRKDIHAKYK